MIVPKSLGELSRQDLMGAAFTQALKLNVYRAALSDLLAACDAAMAQCGELCQGYDGWQTQMASAVAKAKEVME